MTHEYREKIVISEVFEKKIVTLIDFSQSPKTYSVAVLPLQVWQIFSKFFACGGLENINEPIYLESETLPNEWMDRTERDHLYLHPYTTLLRDRH